MNKLNKHIGLHIKGFFILVVLALAVFVSSDALAEVCTVKYNGNSVTPECPNGSITRRDISPKCVENFNNDPNSCVNTMPTTGVSRVPEDVCFRGAGWSRKRNHNGMDYAAPLGTAVTAAADGTITRATGNIPEPPAGGCSDYGNVIYMEHDGCNGKWKTRYGHLHKLAPGIKVGVKVKKGDLIGYVGGTGGACGRYHLHFEMRDASDNLINPMCDQVQQICNCTTNLPSSKPSDCRDPNMKFEASTPGQVGQFDLPIEAHSVTPADENCDYSNYRNSFREWGCIFCKPFMYMFNTASEMAKISFDALAKAVSILVVVAFAIWLSVTTLKFVSSMEIKEPRIYVKTLLNQAFRVLVIYVILNSDLTYLLSLTIDPVFNAGFELAQMTSRLTSEFNASSISAIGCDLDNMKIITHEEGGGLSPEMGTGILCTIKSIQDQVGDVLALGGVTWCMAWKEKVLLIFPHLGYLLTCIAFYAGGFMLLFIYPFLLVDCILKLAIAIALLPAALGAFAFKITSKYLGKIWETFLNAIFSFIFLSIIIFIIAHIAADAVGEILTGDDRGLKIQVGWWTVECMKIVFICLLGWAVLGEAKTFADNFAGGIQFENGIGSDTGSTAGQALKKPATKGAKMLGKGGKALGKGTARLGGEMLHHGRLKAAKFNSELEGKEARDKDGNIMKDSKGNTVYDTANAFQKALNRKVYSSFDTDANGNITKTTEKYKKDGSKVVTKSDRYGTLKSKLDKDGNLIGKVDTNMNAAALKYISSQNGSVNETAINNFMQNSSFSADEKKLMIMNALMNKRINAKQHVGFKLDDKKVATRKFETTTDDQGRETFTVTQTYENGESAEFKMTFGGGDRIMTSVQSNFADGSRTTLATDGIVQQKIVETLEKNENGVKVYDRKEKYSFTAYYNNKSTRPLSREGKFDSSIPKDDIMFSKSEMENFINQVDTKGNKYYKFDDFDN